MAGVIPDQGDNGRRFGRRPGLRRRWSVVLAAAVAIAVVLVAAIVMRFYADWLWFGEVGSRGLLTALVVEVRVVP